MARGSGFLAELVEDWEAAAQPARAAGVRVVHVRTGIVQSARGASLKLLRPLFSAGLGGPLAPGSQWVSWIGLDDLLDVFGRALADDELAGPLNAVAPAARHQPRLRHDAGPRPAAPAVLPVPSFGPRAAPRRRGRPGDGAGEPACRPGRLVAAGHVFRHPALEACLRHQLGHIDARHRR